jgi:hypothetical protein
MCLKCMIYAECSANIFRAISHFTTLHVTQNVGESTGILFCSMLLPIPFCPKPSLSFQPSEFRLFFSV